MEFVDLSEEDLDYWNNDLHHGGTRLVLGIRWIPFFFERAGREGGRWMRVTRVFLKVIEALLKRDVGGI